MTDRSDWLRERQLGIGGSDVPAILGVSPWSTPLDVYRSKVEPVVDTEDAAQMRGRYLESAVADWYADHHRCEVIPAPQAVGAHPWERGNGDRLVQVGGIVSHGLECKTDRYGGAKWGEPGTDQFRLDYQLQCRWYMEVYDLDRWDLAVFFTISEEWRVYTVRRDPAMGAKLRAVMGAWWKRHVEARVPPPPLADHRRTMADLLGRYTEPTGKVHKMTSDALEVGMAYLRAHGEERRAKREKSSAKAALCQMIGNDSGFEGDGLSIKWGPRGSGPAYKPAFLAAADLAGLTEEQRSDLLATHTPDPTRALTVRLAKESK